MILMNLFSIYVVMNLFLCEMNLNKFNFSFFSLKKINKFGNE